MGICQCWHQSEPDAGYRLSGYLTNLTLENFSHTPVWCSATLRRPMCSSRNAGCFPSHILTPRHPVQRFKTVCTERILVGPGYCSVRMAQSAKIGQVEALTAVKRVKVAAMHHGKQWNCDLLPSFNDANAELHSMWSNKNLTAGLSETADCNLQPRD